MRLPLLMGMFRATSMFLFCSPVSRIQVLYQVSVKEGILFVSLWIASEVGGIQLYLSIVDFPIETPFRTFIWNHALELLKITRHIERDTVPTTLPSKLLWLKMTFLDQNISKSNSETAIAILLLMEKVETL